MQGQKSGSDEAQPVREQANSSLYKGGDRAVVRRVKPKSCRRTIVAADLDR